MTRCYSVVVPTYNAEHTLNACLQSVVSQTLRPLEVIVIDDASHDGTAAVLKRMEPPLSQAGILLVSLRFHLNRGPSAARNAGLRKARGTHIAFLDADDVWANDKLEIIDRFAANPGMGLICHTYAEKQLPGPNARASVHSAVAWPLFRMLLRNPAQTSCAVVNMQFAEPFDETMRYCEDHDLWMRIAERATVLRLVGAPLSRLGRPQLSAGGLSENTTRMRLGEMRVYYNFCRRAWIRRIWLLPVLVAFSFAKHGYSLFRRKFWS